MPQDQLERGLIKIWYVVGQKTIDIEEEILTKRRDVNLSEQECEIAEEEYINKVASLPKALKGYVFESKQINTMNGDPRPKREADIGLLVVEPITNWEMRDTTKVDQINLPSFSEGLVWRILY